MDDIYVACDVHDDKRDTFELVRRKGHSDKYN